MSVTAASLLHPPPRSVALIDPTVGAAQRGGSAAFASVYDAHAPRVYALCVGLAGDRTAATEFVQDTFVRVWERLATFRGECAFTSWLHRVAVNSVLESHRADRRRSLRVAIDADFADSDSHDTPTRDGAAAATDVGLSLDLERAIARLPAGARAVFVLYDIEGFPHAEIAQQLGVTEGTSKAHLFRARRLLRGMLSV